jgi:CDP-diacylglycerol--glycerol-3-phosphate 3-phosphatidyltransferase
MQKNIPNILSALRILLTPVFMVMYLQDDIVWRALSIAVFAIAAFTDFMDGYLARHFGVESKIGVFLDPLADKILTFSGFICLAVIDPVLFPWWAVIVIMVRDVFITLLRIFAERRNLEMKTRFTAKVKTFAQMIFLYAFLLMGVFLKADVGLSSLVNELFSTQIPYYLLLLVAAITVYSGIEYLVMNPALVRSNHAKTA